MGERLTNKSIKCLEKPLKGSKVYYDSLVKGLGVCVTASGAMSFVLNYTIYGRERRITIGRCPPWTIETAREKAKKLRLEIDSGQDPLEKREIQRTAWTVKHLFNECDTKHIPNLAPRAQGDVRSMWKRYLLPQLGHKKLKDLTAKDIDDLHREISLTVPVRANRVLEILRHALNLAVRWGEIDRNPANGFKRNAEQPKDRYLTVAELEALLKTLERMPNQNVANLFRLLIFTGARLGEAMNADWSQFDLENGIWTKPSSHTKQRRLHRVPLSDHAIDLLKTMQEKASSSYLFPGQVPSKPVSTITKPWRWVQKESGLHGVRVHDLRHTFASLLISGGEALPVIGKLLGHSQHQTTLRYAHLMDDPLRKAANSLPIQKRVENI